MLSTSPNSLFASARRSLLGSLTAIALLVHAGSASAATFNAGTLIIPMDISAGGQNLGMLRAYGLVYALLRSGVPVQWVIDADKPVNGNDFVISSGSVNDFEAGTPVALPRPYRGGPFLIAAADAAAATAIIDAWQAADSVTVVHELITGSFIAEVSRTLVNAPRLALLQDGYQAIAMSNLNAAGIPDSTGSPWSFASTDLVTEAGIVGATDVNDADGQLFDAATALPRYCHLSSFHYDPSPATPEVVQEVRSWLAHDALPVLHAQCAAIAQFENAGFYVTNAGIIDDGGAPSSSAVRVPWHPMVQFDGFFEADSGAVDSFTAVDSYDVGALTLLNDSITSINQRIVQLVGRLDGIPTRGTLSYLGGHDYSVALPISSNPQTNGVRLYLNGILNADCAAEILPSGVSANVSSPALQTANQITFDIDYSNAGIRTAENAVLVAPVPAGTSFVSASGGGVVVGPSVVWQLGSLEVGSDASVSFTVSAPGDGDYTSSASLSFADVVVREFESAPSTTTVEALCGSSPRTGCGAAATGKSKLFFTNGLPTDKLKWKLGAGDASVASDFGDPVNGSSAYAFCLYDEGASPQPLLAAAIESGTGWEQKGTGFQFKSRDGNASHITGVRLRPGAQGKTQLQVKAGRATLFTPELPVTGAVTAQFVVRDGLDTNCWQVPYAAVTILDNVKLKATGP